MRNRFFPLIAIFLFSAANIPAQDLASLAIRVADPSAAIVPGAAVVLIDLHRGTIHKGETGSSGFLSFDSLPAGEYSLEVEKAGFGKYVLNNFSLVLRDRQTIAIELKVAAAAGATVTVADKPEVVSADAAQGVALTQEYVQNLPVNGRNPETLILMAPGISSASGSGSDF